MIIQRHAVSSIFIDELLKVLKDRESSIYMISMMIY